MNGHNHDRPLDPWARKNQPAPKVIPVTPVPKGEKDNDDKVRVCWNVIWLN